jgi:hypothetical protein
MASLRSKSAHALVAALVGAAGAACTFSSGNTEAVAAQAGGAPPTKADALYAWEGTIRAENIYEGATSGFPNAGDYKHTVEYRTRLEETAKGEIRPIRSLTTSSHRRSS